MSKLTIIIPVYNAQQTLPKCLDSINQQTNTDFTVLLINDGSTDDSLAVARSYEKEYPERYKIIDKQNEGVVKTRHLGIREATTEYIMFMDNDDFIDSNYVATFMEAMQSGDFDMIIGGYRRATYEKTLYSVQAHNTEWTKYEISAPWAKLFRRKFIIDNRIHFLDNPIGEDVYFTMLACQKTDKIKIIPYIGYNWYYNDASVSNNEQKGLMNTSEIIKLLDSIYEVYKGQMNPLVSYFFIRYVIWYLLFSGRNASTTQFLEVHTQLFSWLEEKKIHNTIRWYDTSIQGEPLKNRIAVSLLLFLRKIKATALFSKIYCRGE